MWSTGVQWLIREKRLKIFMMEEMKENEPKKCREKSKKRVLIIKSFKIYTMMFYSKKQQKWINDNETST